jgi:hypothetical protein
MVPKQARIYRLEYSASRKKSAQQCRLVESTSVLCGSEIQRRCLATHQGSYKCIHGRKQWSALYLADEEQMSKRYIYLELNRGSFPRQWNKRYKPLITDVPNILQGNTSPRIQMEYGHVPKCSCAGTSWSLPHSRLNCKTVKKLWRSIYQQTDMISDEI